jgi:hypothetical protein
MTSIMQEQALTQVLSLNDSPWFIILFAMHVDAGANHFQQCFSNFELPSVFFDCLCSPAGVGVAFSQ